MSWRKFGFLSLLGPVERADEENGSDGRTGGAGETGDFGWDVLHGGRSLAVSGCCGIVLLVAESLEPGHVGWARAVGGLGLYVAVVLAFFGMDRREHRRGRASLPLDPLAGGRLGLLFVAVLFVCSGPAGTEGLAGWIALSALLLGGCSDGSWIALAAGRRRIGLRRAWRLLATGEIDARREFGATLLGEHRR